MVSRLLLLRRILPKRNVQTPIDKPRLFKIDPWPRRDSEVAYDLAKTRVEKQLESIDALDAKLAQNFASGSTVIGIHAAILAVAPGAGTRLSSQVLLGLAALAYLALATIASRALWTRLWATTPEVLRVIALIHEGKRESSIRWLATEGYIRNYNENFPLLKAKARALRHSLVLTAVLVALLVAAALAVLYDAPAQGSSGAVAGDTQPAPHGPASTGDSDGASGPPYLIPPSDQENLGAPVAQEEE